MPNQPLDQARAQLAATPLGPEVRRQRERELDKIVRREVKHRSGRLNDRLAKAKDGYKSINEAQSELDDEFEDLRRREGRLSAAEYQAQLEALNAKQARLEQRRNHYRSELVSVGNAIDELEDDPDAVIDDFYDRHHSLERPTKELSW